MLNAPESFPNPLALPLLPDVISGQVGPLAGVLSGLRRIQAGGVEAGHVLTVPCDSPFFPLDLVQSLQDGAGGQEVIVVAASQGRGHPVFGLWPTGIADDLQHWLSDENNRRIMTFLDRHRVVTVDFPLLEAEAGHLDPFLNINTPDDLAEAMCFLGVLE
jgi:molybdopterin-guanine dinucleotide biosynthesis protein A